MTASKSCYTGHVSRRNLGQVRGFVFKWKKVLSRAIAIQLVMNDRTSRDGLDSDETDIHFTIPLDRTTPFHASDEYVCCSHVLVMYTLSLAQLPRTGRGLPWEILSRRCVDISADCRLCI